MQKTALKSYYRKGTVEAGCDEAGRGCLAGPVFASAVILPNDFTHPMLNDSKKLTEKQRYALRDIIMKEAVSWAVEMVTNQEIDRINILNASFLAMNKAVGKLTVLPQHLIIDGNRFKTNLQIPYTCIVKGDSLFYSIAAASVLAKTFRDDYMFQIHEEYPHYDWKNNKGYPTEKHREALRKFGVSPHHRLSFRLLEEQLTLDFS